jgi:uncharacterized protein YcfL
MREWSLFAVILVCSASSAETKIVVAPRSTMATSQLLKGFRESCPNVVVTSDEGSADYVIEANGPNAAEFLKHYRITLFDKQGKTAFSTDKHSPGAATKDVCKFLSPAK